MGAVPKGTPGSKTISIVTCQSKSRKDLILLRSKCNTKTQVTTTWHRPLGPPDAPSILTITAGALGTATVIAKAPIDNGGARITSFTLSANPTKIEGKTERVSSTYKPNSSGEIKISGLIPGDTYVFTLVAHNSVGASASSQASTPFLAPTVPAVPSITTVIATGTNSALITYTAPAFDGGSPITSYTATSFPSGIKATAYRSTAGTIEVSGLVSSTSYTFTMVANNFAGSSLPSNISAAITTFSPPPPPPAVEAPAPTPAPTLAAPAFTLSSSSETRTANIVATGFTISSIGGAIASFAINATPAGMSFSTSTGALTGTPTTIATVTTYTVTATNTTGSTTATFDLTVLAPLSTDATLTTASTVKGQAALELGTPSATLASATAGSVTISTTQAADTSNSGSFITSFSKTNSDATISRIVKYVSGTTYTGFATDTVYNGTAAITAGDFFIVKVTAADGITILYYNIIAKFLPTFSAWANLSKPALAGDFVLTAPIVTGSLAGVFTYSSGTTGVITVSGATANVVASGTSVITSTFMPTNTAAYSSATTTMTITVTAGDYTVGMDGPGGGKVFYVSASSFLCGATYSGHCKFLESAPSGWNGTTEPTKLWGVTAYQSTNITGITDDGFAINTSAGIGLGLKNSIAIVSQGNDTTTAAGVARAYAGGTLNDWYLPTTAELLLMCKWARGVAWTSDETVCSGGLINLGTGDGLGAAGFVQNRYWSSSEYSSDRAWTLDYTSPGNQANNAKSDSKYVRPIRAFATTLPFFTLSSSSETRTVNIAATGFTVTPKGGAISSFTISATPAGMSFNQTTGALSGTPNTVAGATTYTVTATNSSGTLTATFVLTVTFANGSVEYANGSTGPGGGKIFYYSAAGFNCGSEFTSTGSPTGGLCHYLEAAPSAWNTETDPSRTFAQSSPVNYQSTLVNNPTSPQTATATEIGAGYSNTRAIILQGNSNTSTSAAALTDSYTVTIGGVVFDDWYLPSRLELTELHSQRTVLTGFQSNNYWSSSAYNAQGVWIRDFSGTFEGGLDKSNTAFVRPIRAF
jgi:large repetitive protein